MSLAAVEFDSKGKVCRIVRSSYAPNLSVLDILATGHRLRESDVNYCKRDDTLYINDVGGWTGRVYLGQLVAGARHRLWAREDITFSHNGRGGAMISAAEIAALGYDLDYDCIPEPILRAPYGHSSCYYCERCDDMIPEREHCECVFWCDTCGVLQDKKTEACEHYCDQHELQLSHCEWDH